MNNSDPPPPPIMAFGSWRSNAALIADVARLGYLRKEWKTLDCTAGLYLGFWKLWRPDIGNLVTSDINPAAPVDVVADFTKLPFPDRSFDCVVYDPPYKLQGNPDEFCYRPTNEYADRYGIRNKVRWQDRMELILEGVDECARVLSTGYLLVKCQDQVCSGQVRWQSDEVTTAAAKSGLRKVDRLDFPSYRPQPLGRAQKHARRNTSQLLVFKRAR